MDARPFLFALFPEWPPDVFVELRAIPVADRAIEQHFERSIDRLLDQARRLSPTHEVYFGINPRRGRKGTKDAVAHVGALHVDHDGDAADALARFELRPTARVASGGPGREHLYWLLREPITIESPADVARIEQINRGLARALGGDLVACDLSRILRVPGTISHKHDGAFVELIAFDPERRYTLADFEDLGLGADEPQMIMTPNVASNGHGDPSLPVGRRAREFITSGAPIGEQRSAALACARSLLAAGHAVEDVAGQLFAGMERSPQREGVPWTYADAQAIAADLATKPAPPLRSSTYTNGYRPPPETAGMLPMGNSEGDPTETLHHADLGNARRLVLRHGADLRFCWPWRSWLCWDEARWRQDDTAAVSRMAKATVAAMYTEGAGLEDEEARKALVRHAMRSEARPRIDAMISLTRSEPGIPVLPDDLDRDPLLLNVLNGTIDLRTGELLPHERAGLVTKIAPIVHDPEAACPQWLAFLERIMAGNVELIAFLKRAVGYSITGLTTEQVLFIMWGPPDTGKTTFIETIIDLSGDYANSTPAETFLSRRGDSIPNDLARLKGIRLVKAAETEEGKKLAVARIKGITGRDTISARFMRGEWFDFRPQFTPWLATNHKPVVGGTDKAIWDRLRLIPFVVAIPEGEQDPDLPDRLRAELSGILRWAVEGCLEWQGAGLGVPREVRQATADYRAGEDHIATFIEDACLVGEDLKVSARALYGAYRQWCEDNGEEPASQKALGTELTERGYEAGRSGGGGRFRRGLGLAVEPPLIAE